MDIDVQRFHSKFSRLSKKGLPQLTSVNDQLIKLESYSEKLYNIAIDKAQFAQMKGTDYREGIFGSIGARFNHQT